MRLMLSHDPDTAIPDFYADLVVGATTADQKSSPGDACRRAGPGCLAWLSTKSLDKNWILSNIPQYQALATMKYKNQ